MDLVTYVFNPPVTSAAYNEKIPLYIEAKEPYRSLSAFQTKTFIKKLIAGLKAAGLQGGDCVLVHLFNSYLYPAVYFGIIGAGGVFNGSNPALQVFELQQLFKLIQPKLIITSQDLLSNIFKVVHGSKLSSVQIYSLDANSFSFPVSIHPPTPPRSTDGVFSGNDGPTQDSYQFFEDLLMYGEEDWVEIADEQTAKSTTAALFATSGTSGLPKVAALSHTALVAWLEAGRSRTQKPYEVTRLIPIPLFHCFGALFGCAFPILNAEPTYILPRFSLDDFVNTIHRFGITETVVAPPILLSLNRSQLPLQGLLASLRYIVCGGTPMDVVSQQQCYNYLSPEANISQIWGLTEAGVFTIFQWNEKDFTGSVGRLLPHRELKLVGPDGKVITCDSQPGEAYVRSSQQMICYHNDVAATASVLDEEGWFRTGDILSVKDGKYTVHGRSKELIKVRGSVSFPPFWQVTPSELEAVLIQHPGIADVAVVGSLLADGMSEVPRAYIVRSKEPGCKILEAHDVYRYSRDLLASYKALDGGVCFVEAIPRTASGKIQRGKLSGLVGI
ncbi:MAG: hypothetical protein Q9187_005065 [Circinaria calcarea]